MTTDGAAIAIPNALVRTSDDPVLDVVNTRVPVQNGEAFEVPREYVAAGDATIETMGLLDGAATSGRWPSSAWASSCPTPTVSRATSWSRAPTARAGRSSCRRRPASSCSNPLSATLGPSGNRFRHTRTSQLTEALDNLTPADVYEGRVREIRSAGVLVKRETLRRRRRYNLGVSVTRKDVIRPADVREVSMAMSREVSPRL